MTALQNEQAFEDEICADLAAAGWLYDPGDAARYDREVALFPEDLTAWIQASQPKAWETLTRNHGPGAARAAAERLRKSLDLHGVLHVLQSGFDVIGLSKPISVAQFRPALAMNAELQAPYAANRVRVIRQVRYSSASGNSIDLVLFLNGVPVATVEIKTDFTQSVEDAVYQYKKDRLPKAQGREPEPLLSFRGGALVHFARSNSEVRMTTLLPGLDTVFLPFNRGARGAAGNEPNPAGYATSYLWQQVWQRDSWLEILGRYLVPARTARSRSSTPSFPATTSSTTASRTPSWTPCRHSPP